MGKHNCVSYPLRVSKKVDHPPIWTYLFWYLDFSHVSSTLGFKYLITIVDGFSRVTWLYLIENRSEMLSIFKKFSNEIKNQFGVYSYFMDWYV